MPDEGYGFNHSRRDTSGGEKIIVSHKNNTVKLLHKEFRPEGIFLDYKIIIKDKIKSLTISNIITTVK